MGSLSATPEEAKQVPFAPLVPGFRVVPRDDPAALAEAVDDQTAAVIAEVVQGEAGIHPLAQEMLIAARTACDRHGALLIFDEVQCGMGRTGTLWAWQGAGVRPDVMTVAKGLGGGLPIGACIANREFSTVLQAGDHGSTFAGNPLISSAACRVFDTIADEGFLRTVADRGERLAEGLRGLGLRVRGAGLMLAFEHLDAPDLVRMALLEKRLVLNATDFHTVRLLPPLTVSEEEIDEAVRRIGELVG
jgi:acetylornithine/N-succinyldiaminopimelate aminotransferase